MTRRSVLFAVVLLSLTGCTPETAIGYWFPDLYDEATAVATCESRMDPNVVSASGSFHGMWQIGERWHRERFEQVTGVPFEQGVYEPYYATQYARWLYDQQGWDPWSCAR